MTNPFTQLEALTNKLIMPKLVFNILNTNKVLKRFNRKGFLQLKSGGTKITAPIVSSENGSGGSFNGKTDLDISANENITAAEYAWKHYYESLRLYQVDIDLNGTPEGILDLVAQKAKITERLMKENLADGIFSDGTGNSSLDITGLQALMSDSTTYGGIAVADVATWIAQILDNTTDRPVTLPLLSQALGQAQFDEDGVSAMYMRQNVHDQVNSNFLATQKIVNEEMGKLGFKGVLEYEGRPLIIDSHMPAQKIYGVDEKNTYLVVHRKRNLKVVSHESLETSDSMLKKLFWSGNLVCGSRRSNFSLEDIKVNS